MAKIGWKTPEQIEQERPLSPYELLLQEIQKLKDRVTALENKTP